MIYCFRYKSIGKFNSAHIEYKQRNLKQQSKRLNLGKKPVHIRFGEEEEEDVNDTASVDDKSQMAPLGESSVLQKVKLFMNKQSPNTEIEDEKCESVLSKDSESDVLEGERKVSNLDVENKAAASMCVETNEEIQQNETSKIMEVPLDGGEELNEKVDEQIYVDSLSSHGDGEKNEATELNGSTKSQKRNKRKKKKRKDIVPIPSHIEEDKELKKYWAQRYRLFSKFDSGIKMDRGNCSHSEIVMLACEFCQVLCCMLV